MRLRAAFNSICVGCRRTAGPSASLGMTIRNGTSLSPRQAQGRLSAALGSAREDNSKGNLVIPSTSVMASLGNTARVVAGNPDFSVLK